VLQRTSKGARLINEFTVVIEMDELLERLDEVIQLCLEVQGEED
jgi:hypothetical protein